ncbi:pseudouridine synthase [Mangrovimonas spongiae]|uniref:Pseudouridine synthase n=1 Tax=Mangrovimonas spongiae TaxID=2494697 RepID=A0A428K1W5_9FLAO|nr:pseudouridine synthase [Mangrovimonas spongiae]RSK40388.1 pseudouridine synthase [Mangrovimonas spongiae]
MMEQHFKIHKPYGYLSQFVNNQNKRRNKKLLGELGEFPENTMAIGRLDETSEGLLLLTTCGKTSHYINSSKVEKEYLAQVDGVITENALNQLKTGVTISINGKPYQTKPCQVTTNINPNHFPIEKRHVRDSRHGPTSWVSITLTEGKFRQVRKMTAKVGFPTLRLVRVRIGNIHLDLNPGKHKPLQENELPNE